MDAYITLDIGGTNIRCALFSKDQPDALEQVKIKTISRGQTPMERVVSVIGEIWPKKGEVRAICAAVPGLVNFAAGAILLAPNIPGWKDIPFRKIMRENFPVPVFVNNDANLAALGEWKRGAGRGHDNLLFFTISTGLGGGVIIDKRLLEGSIGIAAELGHITVDDGGPLCSCGQRGHLESFSAGTGIENFVKDELAKGVDSVLKTHKPIRASAIAQAAREGDGLSIAAYDRAGYYLGVGLANYLHIFNPSCVIFGGGVAQSADLWMAPFRNSLETHILSPAYLENMDFKIAELGDDAGLVGAYEYIKERLSA